MEFRECRLLTLNEIFQENNPSVTVEKTFLSVGGIKASIFMMKEKGVKYIVPLGFSYTCTTEICKKLNVNYEKIDIDTFIQKYLGNDDYRNSNVFVLPCSSTVLNVREVNNIEKSMIGQSELIIDYIDVVDSKVYLKCNILEGKEYWIDLKVLKMLSKVNVWAENEKVKIIRISKADIKNSQDMSNLLAKDDLELLKAVVFSYKDNSIVQYDDFVTKIEGIGANDIIINYFSKVLEQLQSEKDCDRRNSIMKYSKFLLRYFHMFIIAGSDGYYRNEFANSLEFVLKKVLLSDVRQLKEDWLRLAKMWRRFGRQLGILMNDDEEIINALTFLINSIKEIKDIEINMIENLEKVICCI